jgi:hypothetical protein
MKKIEKVSFYVGYWLLSLTWGALMSAVSLVVFLGAWVMGMKPERYYCGIHFRPKTNWGVSFGWCQLSCDSSIDAHEFGHSLQNCLYGPFWIFLVGLPSCIRYQIWDWQIAHGKRPASDWSTKYGNAWFEHQASEWGEKATKWLDSLDK